jgi:hypothetical protein
MASYNKIQQFAEDVLSAVHNSLAAGHTWKVYLSNATPSASADAVKADLAEITNENGYTAPVDVQNDMSETSGTATVVGTKVVITASGGTVGAFRYIVLYNDTPTSPADPLIAWWDYGTALTLQDGETFAIKFNGSDTSGTIFTLA